jgi:NAD(P)-dependent dehydrogenase (short-subunit alcohol dehydrogenase family)
MKTILIVGRNGKLGSSLSKKYSKTHKVISMDSEDYYANDYENFIEIISKKLIKNNTVKINTVLLAHRSRSQSYDDSELKVGDFNILENEVSTTINIIDNLLKRDLIAQGGKIILFGSTNDSHISQQNLYYHISKSSIKVMVKWLAERLISREISVNGVSMGLVTDIEDRESHANNSMLKVAKDLNINKRPTLFEEVAELVYCITSLKSNQMTGEMILIDGGFTLSDGYYMYTRKFYDSK